MSNRLIKMEARVHRIVQKVETDGLKDCLERQNLCEVDATGPATKPFVTLFDFFDFFDLFYLGENSPSDKTLRLL